MRRVWLLGLTAGISYTLRVTPVRAQGILGSIGGFFGKPLGGFVAAATAPTIANVQGAANQVIGNVDTRINADMTNAGTLVKNAVDHTGVVASGVVSGGLDQADNILTARIAQVLTGVNSSVATAVGEISTVEKQTVTDMNRLVTTVDSKIKASLEQVDDILDTRIDQVQGVITVAMTQADDDVKERIQQADDVAQKALGTADVVVAKETLNLEAALLRVGALLGMVAFVVAALQYLFDRLPNHIDSQLKAKGFTEDPRRDKITNPKESRRAATFKAASTLTLQSLAIHLGAFGLVVGAFFLLSYCLPSDANKSLDALRTSHATALNASMATLDFTAVQYHAAELAVLDPDNETNYRGKVQRAELIRDVLARPGLLGSADGIQQIAAMVAAADPARAVEDAGTGAESPDVITVSGYVRWQLAETRAEEAAAVVLFSHALDVDAAHQSAAKGANASTSDPFVLSSLALHYIHFYCLRPAPIDWPAEVTPKHTTDEVCGQQRTYSSPIASLDSLDHFDESVGTLDRDSTTAYVAMLDAQSDLEAAESGLAGAADPASWDTAAQLTPQQENVIKAKVARLAAAQRVRAAWKTFDDKLAEDSMMTTAAHMAALTLNDVPLVQASWVVAESKLRPLADAKSAGVAKKQVVDDPGRPPPIAKITDNGMRALVAPIRIAWARRYLGALGTKAQTIAAHELTNGYSANESAYVAFEDAYLGYRAAVRAGDATATAAAAGKAATAAAALGLYQGGSPRAPLGSAFTGVQHTAPASANLASAPRLRFL
jgi:hypothetical protein